MPVLILLLFVLLVPSIVQAVTVEPAGTQFAVGYIEPSTTVSGAPLTNLAHCNVYSQVGTASAVKSPDIAVSAPTGGGKGTSIVTVSYAPPYPVSIAIRVTCTNTQGFESTPSPDVITVIDPPAAPK